MTFRSIRRVSTALIGAALLVAAFATSAAATVPTVTTDVATNVTGTEATLNATIDTHGEKTTYGFEYGPTTAYGQNVEPQIIPAGEKSPVHVSIPVGALSRETTYHFRAGAYSHSGGGAVGGADRTLQTLGGHYMVGEESEVEAEQPKITATTFGPSFVPLAPESAFTLLKSSNGAEASCGEGVLSTTVSAPTSEVSVGGLGGFGECTIMGVEATVAMNGCKYVFNVANAGPPYSGSTSISCPAGKKIEAVAPSFCTVKIPGQSLGGSVALGETVNGGGTYVGAQIAATGLSYEKSGPFCFVMGPTSGATMAGNLLL